MDDLGENPLFLETSIFAGCVYFLFDDGERCVPFVVPWRKRTRQELFHKEDGGPYKKRYLSSESLSTFLNLPTLTTISLEGFYSCHVSDLEYLYIYIKTSLSCHTAMDHASPSGIQKCLVVARIFWISGQIIPRFKPGQSLVIKHFPKRLL